MIQQLLQGAAETEMRPGGDEVETHTHTHTHVRDKTTRQQKPIKIQRKNAEGNVHLFETERRCDFH